MKHSEDGNECEKLGPEGKEGKREQLLGKWGLSHGLSTTQLLFTPPPQKPPLPTGTNNQPPEKKPQPPPPPRTKAAAQIDDDSGSEVSNRKKGELEKAMGSVRVCEAGRGKEKPPGEKKRGDGKKKRERGARWLLKPKPGEGNQLTRTESADSRVVARTGHREKKKREWEKGKTREEHSPHLDSKEKESW